MYFYIEPEVAGGLGEESEIDFGVHPPIVSHLHYKFDGWLGDVILESFPVFIVTHGAKLALLDMGATGAMFDTVLVTVSDQFEELYPDLDLPLFWWLKPGTNAGHDDIALAGAGRLVVSQRVIDALRELQLSNAIINKFNDLIA